MGIEGMIRSVVGNEGMIKGFYWELGMDKRLLGIECMVKMLMGN